MRYKVVQVPMNDELVKDLDNTSKQRDQSRSALIREACAKYLADLQTAELDRQYIEGYRRMPEGEEEEAWAKIGEERLAELLAEESW